MLEEIVSLIFTLFIGWALWRGGKSLGSRKGYHVGRQHGRRRR